MKKELTFMTFSDKMDFVDREGCLTDSWGAEFAETGHGLYWSREGDDEFLYFSDHLRDLILKTDLSGKMLMRIGKVGGNSSNSVRFDLDQPTDLAVAPNGDLYVCEGYGKQRIHRFSSDGRPIKSVGSRGTNPLQFDCPHGIWVDTRKREPEVYVADRSNHRIQVLSLDLEHKRFISDGIRLPCCFYQYQKKMFIPDLEARITVLDEQDRVEVQLEVERVGLKGFSPFTAPHALCVDSRGDLYLVEWLNGAGPKKFKHNPHSSSM